MTDNNTKKMTLNKIINDFKKEIEEKNTKIKELEEKKKDLINFEKSFNEMLEKCKTGLESIGNKVGKIEYSGSSVDKSLSDLKDINSGIAGITRNASKKIETQKQVILSKISEAKAKIDNEIKTIYSEIMDLNSKLDMANNELNSLG